MKTNSSKQVVRLVLVVAIVGFALTALTGCGIGHGSYRHGYDGRNYNDNTDYYKSGNSYHSNSSTAPEYYPDNRGYGPMMGYDHSRNGYCRW